MSLLFSERMCERKERDPSASSIVMDSSTTCEHRPHTRNADIMVAGFLVSRFPGFWYRPKPVSPKTNIGLIHLKCCQFVIFSTFNFKAVIVQLLFCLAILQISQRPTCLSRNLAPPITDLATSLMTICDLLSTFRSDKGKSSSLEQFVCKIYCSD